MTVQEKYSDASLRKHMKPYSDADILKECMLDMLYLRIKRIKLMLFNEFHYLLIQAQGIHKFCQRKTLKQIFAATDCYDLTLDESCDIKDTTQLIIFVRYLDRTLK